MASEAVKVIVRCRPLNDREKRLSCEVVVNMEASIAQVQLKKPKADQTPPKLFTFDGVYYMIDTTQQIYEEICFPLVSGVLEGYNGTVFAYGQTGCGKSYTMMGVEDPVENRGIIPRAFDHIFDHVAVSEGVKYLVQASYLEIYNEEVRDLLGRDTKRKLELHEHPEKGVYVQGLSHHKVHTVHDLQRVMELGGKNRSVGATLMNVDSSRSHSIFTINLEMMEVGEDGKERLRAGRLNLVDLAGSERQSKTGSTGERLKEATKINLSLSALGNVISALVDGRSKHIPYRDSKLTRLLQSSLGGNTKTLMVACVSPADNNFDETLSTLRYANRAKNIKNKPHINEDPKDALLREYKEEIERLKAMLLGQTGLPLEVRDSASSLSPGGDEDKLQALEEEKEAIRVEYERKIAELTKQFSLEQADKARLADELKLLQQAKEAQLAAVEERFVPHTSLDASEGVPSTLTSPPPTLTVGGGDVTVEGGGDRQALVKHEAALERLEEIQKEMVGGEKAGDSTLKQQLRDRQRHAEERFLALRHANDLLDDDGIIEGIFNSLTEEVRIKTHLLERTQARLRSAEEDTKDLCAEFELDREDYLETIRQQERTIQLQQQLLETVVPLLRRDCNYCNLDKVRSECVWDGERSQWILPRVTVTKTSLSPVTSKTSLPERKTLSSSKLTKPPGVSNVDLTKGASPHPGSSPETDRYLLRLQKSGGEPEYFKPKRAMELLAQGAQLKEIASPEHRDGLRHNGSLLANSANAAAVHGVGAVMMSETTSSRKHGRLQSLPLNPMLPQSLAPLPEPSILDRAEKKLSRKRNCLEPLSMERPRRPPP